MTAAPRYAVDLKIQDFTAGTCRTFRVPKQYKTRTGAERAAQGLSYVCRPDGQRATAEQSATVSEVQP